MQMSADVRLKRSDLVCEGSTAALLGVCLLFGTHRLWRLETKPTVAQCRAGAMPGHMAHAGPHALPSLSHGAPVLPVGSLPPLGTPQVKGSSA